MKLVVLLLFLSIYKIEFSYADELADSIENKTVRKGKLRL